MKIITRAVWDWDGNLLEEKSFEYSGPLVLCDRGTSKQVAKQGLANSAQDQANAQGALGSDNAAITNYTNAVKAFQAANPYGVGGQFAQDQRTINADSSNAGTNAIGRAMSLNATRTGQNAASYAPALAEEGRQASRDEATAESKADQTRIASDAAYRAQGTGMLSLTPDMYNRIYGTSISGANGALGTAGSAAAASPSFGDIFGTAAAGALGKSIGTIGISPGTGG